MDDIISKYDDVFETFYQEKIIDKIFSKGASVLSKEEFANAMVPSMFGDMFGAVGNLGGGLVLMNKI